MQGYVDQFRFGVLSGWACDPVSGHGTPVSVHIDGVAVTTLPATIPRPDVLAAGIGDGRSGFHWEMPDRFDDGRKHLIEVVFQETGEIVPNGRHELVFEIGFRRMYAELLRRVISRGIWAVDQARVAEGTLTVSGWVVPPFDVETPFAVSVNGAFVPGLTTAPHFVPQFRRDVRRFEGRLPLAALGNDPEDLCIRVHFGPRLEADDRLAFHVPLRPAVMPDAERQRRVQGEANDYAFNRTGSSTARKLAAEVARLRGRPLGAGDRVLDWGIGCGRVARFVAGMVPGGIQGADVDADNVAWCNANVAGVTAHAIRHDPPMPFADSSFDVLYGISVFTHLSRADEAAWLAEIDRVLAPGGLALLTTHGDTSWWRHQCLGPVRYVDWQRQGLMVVGANADLDGAGGGVDTSRYLDTFTSRRHVADQWGLRFDILDHVEGLVECNQDLVVLRSRKHAGR